MSGEKKTAMLSHGKKLKCILDNTLEEKLTDIARKEDLDCIKAELQDLKTENNRLKNEIKTLTTRIEFIDRKTRQSNVVVNGLNCKNIGAAKSDFTELCKDTLDVNVSIVNTSIINKNTVKFNLET